MSLRRGGPAAAACVTPGPRPASFRIAVKGELDELQGLADQLVEEIQVQRDLIYAESGDLEPESAPVQVLVLLARLQVLYRTHPVARDCQLVLDETWPGSIETDQRLLGRVLGNMIKNALEATDPGGTVTVRCCEKPPRHVVFSVHNDGVMPKEIQMQVFQRSFSTKAVSGRGIGTHSMKLFGERYLGGKVDFTSREPEGTTFSLTLPKVMDRGKV
jgi:signal transduction histidine kinase